MQECLNCCIIILYEIVCNLIRNKIIIEKTLLKKLYLENFSANELG